MLRPALTALLLTSTAAMADVPRVVTDIAPVHSLVAQVMGDLGQPELLVRPGASPHGYSLRPSEARALDDADLVVMVGEGLTPWLMQPVQTLAGDAHLLDLLNVEGATRLEARTGATFEKHSHAEDDDHGHDDHDDDHAQTEGADHDDHDHDHDHDHDDHDDHDHAHDHDALDSHAWLDPRNGAVWLEAIAAELAELDPENADTYRTNAETGKARLATLETEIAASLPENGTGFIVFHDAYQYFETRFGLAASGSISLSDATAPSAGRISELRDKIDDLGVTCVFTEPQFDSGIIAALGVDGLNTATLDPMGTLESDPGADLYPQTLRAMGVAFAECVAPQG